MKPRPTKSSQSQRDLSEILSYFEKVEPLAGVRFIDALDHTLVRIGDFPDLGNPSEFKQHRLRKVRLWMIRGFENYVVVYQNTKQGPLILRILDARRDLDNIL